jgi:hypothetical protein
MFDVPRPHPVSVSRLKAKNDPFDTLVWWKDLDTPLTIEEVTEVVEQGCLQAPDSTKYNEETRCSRKKHIERVAWLVVHGWDRPIHIDVGVAGFSDPTWLVGDGNHRLAAAIVREDDYIEALVSGSIARLQNLLEN